MKTQFMRSVPRKPRQRKKYIPRTMRLRRKKIIIIISVALSILLLAAVISTPFIIKSIEETRIRLEKQKYPLKMQELIEKYANMYEFDPAFISAVVLNESSFKPDAVSSVGARGLMQIMPATASDIARRLGEEETFQLDDLFDAETSLRYGCYYLNWLNKTYNYENDIVKLMAAYHAGQGNVKAWLKQLQYSADGVMLDYIPISNTRVYVERIQTAYEKYQSLYVFNQETDDGDTASPQEI